MYGNYVSKIATGGTFMPASWCPCKGNCTVGCSGKCTGTCSGSCAGNSSDGA